MVAPQALALDVGLSTSIEAGPVSVSTSVEVSGSHAGASGSVGVDTTGTSAEAAVSSGSNGVTASGTANTGDISAGVSGGVSTGGESPGKGARDSSPSAASAKEGAGTTGRSSASREGGAGGSRPAGTAVARSIAPPAGVRLPEELVPRMTCTDASAANCEPDRPSDREIDGRTPQYRGAMAALGRAAAVPVGTVTACRNGIIWGARPHDPVRIDAVSAGKLRRMQGGGVIAPLMVRIVYDRQGGYEIREAKVNCQLNANGAVVVLS